MKSTKEFNYCVGHYWEGTDGAISTYTLHNNVFYGTLTDAKAFKKYVKSKCPEDDIRIFQIVEIPE
jgi:hypothetical protein